MRSAFLFLVLSFLILAGPGMAQQRPVAPVPTATGQQPEAKPRKLSRKERKELARRAEVEAASQQRQLSDRDRGMSEAFFVDGVKYVLLEDYNKALERH